MTANKQFALTALACLLGGAPLVANAAATIIVVNADGPGEGFNDPTPVAPIGGNSGTTLGQQRLIAFQTAADLWGAKLNSAVPIRIKSNFDPLTCDANSATLGAAGPLEVGSDFRGAPRRGTWYHGALANKIIGTDDFAGRPVIQARFNSNLGTENCLAGGGFYLGLDGQHNGKTDLVGVLLHEFGHGLGFSNLTNGQTGRRLSTGKPSAWDYHMLDLTTNKLWSAMTDAERKASGINSRNLVWVGANVTREVPNVLRNGVPQLRITAPLTLAGNLLAGAADFGAPLTASGLSGTIAKLSDQADGTGLACTPLTAANAVAVQGKLALIDRGTCTFSIKVKNAQDAGAIGVIIADNVAGSPPPGLAGSDPTITIPAARITKADADRIKTRLNSAGAVKATLGLNNNLRAGADTQGRVMMFTPNPYQPGSSVSHFDTSAKPDLLMEPQDTEEVKRSVDTPQDLTYPLLRDLGW
ncbi:peptidase [Chitinimonas arctica]|uniref:Peptidase n=1 Tax=Chitinimonas arctica TaxID=2594795 RepID=A0A516SCP5_9NEIS|nr:PA domain-containing protein [Chitinimonas arctica]QDQ25911.1 peptidase [Chitinimonas arctica]